MDVQEYTREVSSRRFWFTDVTRKSLFRHRNHTHELTCLTRSHGRENRLFSVRVVPWDHICISEIVTSGRCQWIKKVCASALYGLYPTAEKNHLTAISVSNVLSNKPFLPKSDRFQISPAASPEILHHTVWRTWPFIAYWDGRWLCYQFLTTFHSHVSFKRLGECTFWTWEWKGQAHSMSGCTIKRSVSALPRLFNDKSQRLSNNSSNNVLAFDWERTDQFETSASPAPTPGIWFFYFKRSNSPRPGPKNCSNGQMPHPRGHFFE